MGMREPPETPQRGRIGDGRTLTDERDLRLAEVGPLRRRLSVTRRPQ